MHTTLYGWEVLQITELLKEVITIKKILCIVTCLIFVSLSVCTNKPDYGNDLPDSDISNDQVDMSSFLNKEYIASDKFSSDIDSYQVQIYDTVFTFPFYYDELIADGWVLGEYEDPNEELDSYYERSINFKKGYVILNKLLIGVDVE